MTHSERGEWDGSKVKFATIEMGSKNIQQRNVLSSMNGESDMTVSQVKMEAGQQTSKEVARDGLTALTHRKVPARPLTHVRSV